MREPLWVPRVLVEAIHFDQIREHGGRHGLRDEGALEAALAKPRNRWARDAESDLARLAAAYAFGIARNHPFVDGNERVALLAMYTFLGLNGQELEAPEAEVVVVVREVAAGKRDERALAAWVRRRSVPARTPP